AATRGWRSHAQVLGLGGADVSRMEQALDNQFRSEAARLTPTVVPRPAHRPPAPGPVRGEQPRSADGRFTRQ
ncbi:MAG: hypothetical protein ACRD0J_01025, partial [Acidimicrobiales bacterium]